MQTILMVDDEPHLDILVRQKFRREIKSGEYNFHFARNGVEALRTIEATPEIDLVITDINMPEMDGLTLLEKLDQKRPDLRAIIISAYNDLDNVKTAMDRGAFEFITKPVDLNELADTIKRSSTVKDLTREDLKKPPQDIQHELNVASKLQQSILPSEFPKTDDVELFATMNAAQDVAGDFYCVRVVPDQFWRSIGGFLFKI